MSSTIALIRSAFGPKTTLYDALLCSKDASQADLKKSYRRLALRNHPDKQVCASSKLKIKETTLKFQAVSAAYQVLMDSKRRSAYDTTGRVVDEDDDDDDDDEPHNADVHNPASSYGNNNRSRNRSSNHKQGTNNSDKQQQQRRWDDFFHSVFNEILTAQYQHGDADSYRGSTQETVDVLKFYATCKGDLEMVVKCVVHGNNRDVNRWRKDIIAPAIVRGDIEDFCGLGGLTDVVADTTNSSTQHAASSVLVDSDEDEDDDNEGLENMKNYKISTKKKRLKRSRLCTSNTSLPDRKSNAKTTTTAAATPTLVDTDDDEDGEGNGNDSGPNNKSGISSSLSSSSTMNRRDKMEYRIAKKRKLKAVRELEVANIMKSKNWSSGVGVQSNMGRQQQRHRSGTFSDALLSNMEKKYSTSVSGRTGATKRRSSSSSSGGIRSKMRRKK